MGGGSLLLTQCLIASCNATEHGGGIHVEDGAVTLHEVTLRSCMMVASPSTGAGQSTGGGGISVFNGNVMLSRSYISNCSAISGNPLSLGAGLWIENGVVDILDQTM